ncbi:hypothetical protein TPE_2459 [Treponema pedis str. T A4]|uniref:Uncharacterized protein n=1 Tax=Treponema pedis str. T A4 TaxID=1291379 RepID=S6A1V6_9SPIR|nr:hypothetical protein TPE_2459 [Treponema pedis str. T A4]
MHRLNITVNKKAALNFMSYNLKGTTVIHNRANQYGIP